MRLLTCIDIAISHKYLGCCGLKNFVNIQTVLTAGSGKEDLDRRGGGNNGLYNLQNEKIPCIFLLQQNSNNISL